jgi:hypothetical protein
MKKKYPLIMNPQIEMIYPNQKLKIHQGIFTINWKTYSFELEGEIIFKWLPVLSVFLQLKGFDTNLVKPFETELLVKIKCSSGLDFEGKGIISRIEKYEEYNLIVFISPPIEFGDSKSRYDHIRFEIANLRELYGTPVMSENIGYKNRIILRDQNSKITIDKHPIYNSLNHDLKESNGYQLLYTGKLQLNNRKKITYDEAKNTLDSFSYFLSFVNGIKTFPLFRQGILKEQIVWKSATPYLNDQTTFVLSWVTDGKNNGLSNLWKNFNNMWQNPTDQECIINVLHWYVIANIGNTFLEGSIVLLQNALELLFYWLIVEKFQFVTVSDADNTSASSKIGFLLSHYDILPNVPDEFDHLIKYCKQNNIINGPESFTRIRNCIVHPSSKKRKNLKEVEQAAKIEALHLGLWYVELILLKHLNFKGIYKNRCKNIKYKNPNERIK